jgi:hypothetical protein
MIRSLETRVAVSNSYAMFNLLLNSLVDLNPVDSVAQVLFTSKQYFFLDASVLRESRR